MECMAGDEVLGDALGKIGLIEALENVKIFSLEHHI